jgi:hypothetical protein
MFAGELAMACPLGTLRHSLNLNRRERRVVAPLFLRGDDA